MASSDDDLVLDGAELGEDNGSVEEDHGSRMMTEDVGVVQDDNPASSSNERETAAAPPETEDPSLDAIRRNDDPETLRIMITTDNHLGYNERDPVRGMDSFAAFEEVMYLAKYRYDCDMVLIAGDLFHDHRPSRRTLYKTMEILRRYCLGSNPVKIQILSDQAKHFRNVFGTVNYQDPNYSVDLPLFAIHGNHDDPSRECGDLLAALDLLTVSNLANYWGRQEQVDQVDISPVLIQKGNSNTKVALYGLGNMRDERLHRMWQARKVRFWRPESTQPTPPAESEAVVPDEQHQDINQDDASKAEEEAFFNIFVLHQNRDLGRGSKNCIQESMIPEWMDLVVWGHEHECLLECFESVVGTYRITQPGSSVATSLVSGEAVRKKVGLLDIRGTQFRLLPIPLTQVRSFVTTDLCLREHRANLDADDPRVDAKINKVLEDEVRLLIFQAKQKMEEVLSDAIAAGNDAGLPDSPLQYRLLYPEKALVRIRVDHAGFGSLNNSTFGAKFVGEIANPEDMLLFHRRKDPTAASRAGAAGSKAARALKPLPPEELSQTNMEDLVQELLAEHKLKLLSERELNLALEEYVDKSTISAIPDAATKMLRRQQDKLILKANSAGEGPEAMILESAAQIRELVEMESQKKVEQEEREQQAQDNNQSKRKRLGTSIDIDEEFEETKEYSRMSLDDDDKGGRSLVSSSQAGLRSVRSARKTAGPTTPQESPSMKLNGDDHDPSSTGKSPSRGSSSRPTRGASQRVVNYSLTRYDDDDDDGHNGRNKYDEDDDEVEVQVLDSDDEPEDHNLDDDDDVVPAKRQSSRSRAPRGGSKRAPAGRAKAASSRKPAATSSRTTSRVATAATSRTAGRKPAAAVATSGRGGRMRPGAATTSSRMPSRCLESDEDDGPDVMMYSGTTADLDDDWGSAYPKKSAR